MDRTAERLHAREEIDRRTAPKMTIHLVDAKIDHYEQLALCGQMVGRSGCREEAPVDNPRVTVCPACQATREATQTPAAETAMSADTQTPIAVSADWFAQAVDATHAYGAPETLVSYRDRDGGEFHATLTPQTVAVRTRTRRRVTTTYPNGTVEHGWETLSETTAPYEETQHMTGSALPQTLDGYTITTIEQNGDSAGHDVGRLWFKTPGRDQWTWYGNFASETRRQDVIRKAQTCTFQDFDAWWDTDHD